MNEAELDLLLSEARADVPAQLAIVLRGVSRSSRTRGSEAPPTPLGIARGRGAGRCRAHGRGALRGVGNGPLALRGAQRG